MPLGYETMAKIPTGVPEISRITRSKQETKSSYDRLSKWYDVLAGHSEKKLTDFGLQKLGVKEGELVLEIGFGTGHCILAIAKSVGNLGKVYGIDISEGMFNSAQARVRETGLAARVELRCGDATELPFGENCFDAIFMSFTLELFDSLEIPMVLHECLRVLRNGGRLCVVALSIRETASLMTKLYEWAHRRFPSYIDCRPIFVRKAIEEAGFQVVDVTETSTWGLPVEIVTAKKRERG
jgi:demethylmenaquinone methyltransferase/2-methoxy-6-polyprenyl-1,4-benzoquinol methylase